MSQLMDYRKYVASLPLQEALWWFIENVTEETPQREEIFFDLRDRYRAQPPLSTLVDSALTVISDVEAMLSPAKANTFGPFTTYSVLRSGEFVQVEWANLAKSAAGLKKSIQEARVTL